MKIQELFRILYDESLRETPRPKEAYKKACGKLHEKHGLESPYSGHDSFRIILSRKIKK